MYPNILLLSPILSATCSQIHLHLHTPNFVLRSYAALCCSCVTLCLRNCLFPTTHTKSPSRILHSMPRRSFFFSTGKRAMREKNILIFINYSFETFQLWLFNIRSYTNSFGYEIFGTNELYTQGFSNKVRKMNGNLFSLLVKFR